MSYGETFFTTGNKKNFPRFIDRIKTVGAAYYDAHGANPQFIVTVKETVFDRGGKKPLLKKSKRYVYFSGDGFIQRRPNRILNVLDGEDKYFAKIHDLTGTALDAYPFRLESVSSEALNPAKLFAAKGNKKRGIYAGLSNNFIEVSGFGLPEAPEEDINELYTRIAEDSGGFAGALGSFVFACIYDKPRKFPQANREFARLLSNLSTIRDLAADLLQYHRPVKTASYLEDMAEETTEYNQTLERLVNCFKKHRPVNVKLWNSIAKFYTGQTRTSRKYLCRTGKSDAAPWGDYCLLHKRLYEIIKKYRESGMKNIGQADGSLDALMVTSGNRQHPKTDEL